MPLVPFVPWLWTHFCFRGLWEDEMFARQLVCRARARYLSEKAIVANMRANMRKCSSQVKSSSNWRSPMRLLFGPLAGATRERSGVSASHARLFGACGCVSGREGPETIERRLEEDRTLPVKRHRVEPGHTRDARDTRTHKGTRATQTNLTTIRTHQQHTPRTSARRPKPRPTQQQEARSRPLPAADSEEAAPSKPDSAPTRSQSASRACSKAVGEMKARAADA
jgi:hypothetical protein